MKGVRSSLSTAFVAITLISSIQAFQTPSSIDRRAVVHHHHHHHHATSTHPSIRRISTSSSNTHPAPNRGTPSLSIRTVTSMHSQNHPHKHSHASSLKSSSLSSFFPQKNIIRSTLRKIRRSLTILLASLSVVLSCMHIHASPAHASSVGIAASKTTSSSPLFSKIDNPLRPRSSSELIDRYVRDRLFADDVYDPIESSYREAFADYPPSGGGEGPYPAALAESAASALGRKDASSLILSARASESGNDGGIITTALIRASDVLQKRLGVNSGVSYYIIAAALLMGCTVLPGVVGMSYQAFQRLQIDKSEMKMYGKITDIAANAKKITEDSGGNEEEEEDKEGDADDEEE